MSTEAAIAPVFGSIPPPPIPVFGEDASCALSCNWIAYLTSPQLQFPSFDLL